MPKIKRFTELDFDGARPGFSALMNASGPFRSLSLPNQCPRATWI